MIVVARNMQQGRREAAARGLTLSEVRLVTSRHDLYKLQGLRDLPVVYCPGWEKGKQPADVNIVTAHMKTTQGSVEPAVAE